MNPVDLWQQPVTLNLCMGDVFLLHAGLTNSVAARMSDAAGAQEAAEACNGLFAIAGEDTLADLLDRMMQVITTAAPEVAALLDLDHAASN